MGKRSFVGLLNQMARESARQQRQAEAYHRRQIREQERAFKTATREAALAAKEAKQQYLESRAAEAEDLNQDLSDRINDLDGILQHTLNTDDWLNFDSLRIRDPFPSFKPSSALAQKEAPPSQENFLPARKHPGFWGKIFPSLTTRYNLSIQEAEESFRLAHAAHASREAEREAALDKARSSHRERKAAHDAKIEAQNQEVLEFETAYKAGDPKAIVGYYSMVLDRSDYPDDFNRDFRMAYVPESRQLVLDYEFPGLKVIPTVQEYRYIKSKDILQEKDRKPSEIQKLYADIIASIALRTCHELFESDREKHLDVIAFNGFAESVDPATGKSVRPCLLSLRVTASQFREIDLGKVDLKACLRNLGAHVSPRPHEIQPVKPIVNFDMVDHRFVEQSDVLSELDSRPDLMALNPFEFEQLVANLFKKMGLETKLTRSSRDGGVDAVAFDVRPILGGKVVIQAKRYRNTVGVSAVRDLFGTMMNEGASKGILVTTSGYGPDAFKFAKEKPIELIDGGQLLYLLKENGTHARILIPDD